MTRFVAGLAALTLLGACAAPTTSFVSDADIPTDGSGKPDGSKDGGVTDGAPTDGGGDVVAPPQTKILCGSIFCRADQQCQNNACVTACTGSKVPGDYATIQGAVTALATAQMDATICLSGQTYSEAVTAAASPTKLLTIIGTSGTKINSLSVTGSYSKVTLKAFGVGTVTINGPSPVDAIGIHADTFQASTAQVGAVLIDGCDLGATAQSYGLYVYRTTTSQPLTVTAQNTWFHGATNGAFVNAVTNSNLTAIFLNDTFTASGRGLYSASTGTITLTYLNSIFSGLTIAGITLTGGHTVTHSNNLLFGNAANYAGTAVDGAGYVKADPLLDTGTPPELKQGSPARGAADVAKAPAKDYWAVPRGSSADIGAVEGN